MDQTSTKPATAAAVAALAALAWAPGLRGDLQFDDLSGVLLDPATHDGAALLERLVTGVRPLTRLSFFAEAATLGLQAGSALAVNLALHAACVVLVLVLARRRLTGTWPPIVAACIFAFAPSHGEVVAYVSGRSVGLSTLLVLLALWLHERGCEASRHRPWFAASVGVAALAALARETALVYPLLLALWEWTREGRGAWRHVGLAAASSLVVAALLAVLPRYRTLAAFSLEQRSPLEALALNLRALPELLSFWVKPWALSIDHASPSEPPRWLAVLLGLALLAVVALALRAGQRGAVTVALAVLWALLALAPTHGFVAKLDPLDEKPLYLALVGPALGCGALAAWAGRVALGRALVVGLLAFLAGGAWSRATVFADPRTLWADAATKAPARPRCWNNLGAAYWKHGQIDAARGAFERALIEDPGYGPAESNLRRLDLLEGRRR